ncbi:hypothetical protein QOZ80_1AG0008480 [Eleusine coracana subsp. coracana]|nr:hypothetical protein QOZ80_1AG0008480 [Eleusine coracana subsp. coracana]
MVISAEPPPPPPPDPVADAATAEVTAATSTARQAAFSSFPSLKTWGSHRVLRCAAHVSRGGGAAVAATARRPVEKLREVGEKLLRHHDEVEAAGSESTPTRADADADDAAEEEEAPEATRPRTRRRRRRGTAVPPPASMSPPAERRPPRAARGEQLDRARFSVTLTAEEIDEDIYAVTGARARRRPRRRPRPVQKQLDMLFPGSWLSEITAETYRVPDDR